MIVSQTLRGNAMMNLLSTASIIISLLAAVFGIRAATAKVLDNLDGFISDL